MKNNFAGDLQSTTSLEMLLIPSLLAHPVKCQYIMTIIQLSARNNEHCLGWPEHMEKLKASGAVVHSVHDVHGQALSNSCEVKSCGSQLSNSTTNIA